MATSICQGNSSDEDLLVAPSLHAFIENLPLVASASKGGLTLALVQVAVTIFVNLTLGGVAFWLMALTFLICSGAWVYLQVRS